MVTFPPHSPCRLASSLFSPFCRRTRVHSSLGLWGLHRYAISSFRSSGIIITRQTSMHISSSRRIEYPTFLVTSSTVPTFSVFPLRLPFLRLPHVYSSRYISACRYVLFFLAIHSCHSCLLPVVTSLSIVTEARLALPITSHSPTTTTILLDALSLATPQQDALDYLPHGATRRSAMATGTMSLWARPRPAHHRHCSPTTDSSRGMHFAVDGAGASLPARPHRVLHAPNWDTHVIAPAHRMRVHRPARSTLPVMWRRPSSMRRQAVRVSLLISLPTAAANAQFCTSIRPTATTAYTLPLATPRGSQLRARYPIGGVAPRHRPTRRLSCTSPLSIR